MQTNAFKRAVAMLAPAKEVKARIRLIPRKTQTALAVHSILNLNIAVPSLQYALQPFILGSQLNDEMRANGKQAMGEIFQHLMQLARVLKVKVPSAGKKVSIKGKTFTEALLLISERSASIQSIVTELLAGNILDSENNIDAESLELLKDAVQLLLDDLYAFSYSVLGVVPAEILDAHYAFLVEQHGEDALQKPVKPAAE